MSIYWYRGLALAVLLVVAGMYGPYALDALGLPVIKLPGDGSTLIIVGLVVYVVAFLTVLSLVIPAYRELVVPKQSRPTKFATPLLVICGYVVWVTVLLFDLSQATDL